MKRIIALILVLVVTIFIIKSSTYVSKYVKIAERTVTLNPKLNPNWEYIKDRLFTGNGDDDYAYKINYRDQNYPILINLQDATPQDSIAINEIINELKTIIPNRKFLYFKDLIGKSFAEAGNEWENFKSKNATVYNAYEPLFKGLSYSDLRFTTIQLSFSKEKDKAQLFNPIATTLSDGSRIERENQFRRDCLTSFPDKVWFHLNDSISNEKRKQYIQYEILKTLCYIHPNAGEDRLEILGDGVFSTPDFRPETAIFNHMDQFLIKKLYEDDFTEQFQNYLNTSYSWLYATNFLNKGLTKVIFWCTTICLVLFVFILLFSLYQSKKIKNAYLNYFIPVFFTVAYFINSVLLYSYFTKSPTYNNVPLQNFINAYLITIAIAIIGSFLLWLADKFWIDRTENFTLKLALKIIFTFTVFNIPVIVLLFMGQFKSKGFAEILIITLIVTGLIAFGRGVLIYLNHFSENLIKEKDLELSKLKEVNSQAEVKLLQSQINPHFLYNALNSIASLAPIDALKTQKMAHSLSDLFKYSINRKGENTSTIKDEIEMVKTYLEVEKIRFENHLQFHINVDPDLENHKIPLFLIQPLVENAIIHGVSKNVAVGKIKIKVEQKNNDIHISVSDNGPNFPDSLFSGHGLQTVYDLLRLNYEDQATLNWTNTPEKTITITLPKTTSHE